jgi:hypothetical protein
MVLDLRLLARRPPLILLLVRSTTPGEGDLLATPDVAPIGPRLVSPDRRVDLREEPFLLLDHYQIQAPLGDTLRIAWIYYSLRWVF